MRTWLGVVLLLVATPLGAESVGILRHPDHAAVPLDRALLRDVFTMRVREWPDGARIRVFVLADDNPLHARFAREQLATFPYVLRSIWDRLVFTGTGDAPATVATEQEMYRRVRSTPGAIGYIGMVDEARHPPARVVPVQGGDR